jgi:hypothetical protein
MTKIDCIEWREFPKYLSEQQQCQNMKDIPTFLSLLIAFARTQLHALTSAEGTLTHKRNATAVFAHTDRHKRQRLEQLGAQVTAAVSGASTNDDSKKCSYCGRQHHLEQCSGVQNLIAQHKTKQLAHAGPFTGKPHFRGGSTSNR